MSRLRCERCGLGYARRKVIGFMSDNHIDPDLAVEVFVLEPLPPAPR